MYTSNSFILPFLGVFLYSGVHVVKGTNVAGQYGIATKLFSVVEFIACISLKLIVQKSHVELLGNWFVFLELYLRMACVNLLE